MMRHETFEKDTVRYGRPKCVSDKNVKLRQGSVGLSVARRSPLVAVAWAGRLRRVFSPSSILNH